jgi:Xaa-Pro aminopeptidase
VPDDDERRKARGLTPPVPVEELRRRILRAQQAMERHGFDALFIYGTPSPQPDWVRYLVNFVHPYLFTGSFAVLARQGEPVLLIDREWNLPNAREMAWVEDVRWYPYGAFRWQFDQVAHVFARVGADLSLPPGARIGILELETPVLYSRALTKAFPRAELAECRGVLGELVRTPTPYDLAMMRRTARVADAGMRAALDACREGVPEYEVGLASMRAMAALGAEFFHGGATSTHVNIGAGSGVISNVRPYLFTGKRLERGEMFWLDLSAMYRGYYVDFDRTAVIGPPRPEQRRLYDVCREIYEALQAALRPGVTGGELYRVGQAVAERHNLGTAVNHVYLGHATGITTNERPFLVEGETQPVTAGCLINLEPGIFVPEVGGTSLEDTFLVREDGIESLTQCDRTLHIA